jgi:quinol monooxygenase YgiN
MTQDQSVSLHPYFKIHSGKVEAFKALCKRFVEKTKTEPGCLYYAFTFEGDVVFCREGYVDGAALLAHIDNVGALLKEALTIADVTRLEAHGPAAELDKLRQPLSDLNPQYFLLDHGFRR